MSSETMNATEGPSVTKITGTTTTTSSSTSSSTTSDVCNGVKDPNTTTTTTTTPLLNGFHNNNNINNAVNGWTSLSSSSVPFLPTNPLQIQPVLNANSFVPKGVVALPVTAGTGPPRGLSPKRPNRYNSSPRSRGGSPNSPVGGVVQPAPHLNPGQHVVHLHVNPGESISLQMGNDLQLIQGPATVRMVSNNSSPPIPMPVQVPPGHMVQQIVDETGTLRHVILSPQPPMAVSMGPPTYGPGPAPNTGPPTNPPFYTYHPAYPHPVSTQYHPHHPNGPLPPHHMAHPLHSHGPTHPHQCSTHHQQQHQGSSPPPLHPLLHKDDRTQRQFIKLKRKLDARQRENHAICHTSPPTSPRKENGIKKYKDRNTSTSGLDDTDRTQEDVEEARVLTELLSNVCAPQVSQVTARSAFLQWKPPNMYSESGENKYSEYDIQESEFVYDVLMSDRGKEGKYRVICSLGGLEYLLKELKPAKEYYICIQALLDDLRGQPSEAVILKTLSCEPDTPSAPKLANRTKTSLTLRWNAVADNGSKLTAYILESDESKGSAHFQEIFRGVQRQLRVMKLTLSTCYRFRLAAVNEIGRSGYSEVVCYSTSGSAPVQPTSPQLKEALVNRLHLEWEERPNDDTYTLQMDDSSSGHGFLPVFNGPETSYLCCGLRRNSEYTFRLCANNEEGSSHWSDTVVYRTLPDRPGAPGRPTLKGCAHSTSFRVSWEPPKDNGGADITSYILQMDSGNGFEERSSRLDNEFHCERLSPGQSYRFRVSCVGPGGNSSFSEVGTISTVPVCPGQCSPPRLHGKAKAISVHLKWGPPERDGGSPITEYEIDVTNPDSSSRLAYRGRETDCVVAGLLPGKPYQFRVRAYNKVGDGAWSDTLDVTSSPGAPSSPNEPQVTCKSPHSAMVSWEEPNSNGAPITEYRLEVNHTDSEFSQSLSGLSYEVKGLSPAAQYSFRVQAVNSAGCSPFSQSVAHVTPPWTPAAVSASTVKVACEPYSLTVSWQAPNCNGSDIVAYNIDLGDRHSPIAVNGDVCEHRIEGLSPETTFRIRIQAVNGVGAGPLSTSTKASTKALPPNPPKLDCVLASHNSLRFKWGEGRNVDFTQYTLEMETRIGCFVPLYQGTSFLYKVGRLSETTEYRFRIVASNDAGRGPYSEVYVFGTTKAPPPATKVIRVSNITETSGIVEWQPVRPFGEDRLLYQLQLLNSRDQEYRVLYKGNATSYEIQGLEPKVEYTVRVGAIREYRDGTGCLVGPFGPGTSFVTLCKEVPKVEMTDDVSTSQLCATKQLTDQQWAFVILCGFTVFAVLVAVLLQNIIAYRKGTS